MTYGRRSSRAGTFRRPIDVTTDSSFRDHLRAIPSLVGHPVGFDPASHPSTPQELFLDWFRAAEEAGIAEPHAMSVATVDAEGVPDTRLLVLKDLTADGAWCFAGKRDSAKGRQLSTNPVAALTFYWRELVAVFGSGGGSQRHRRSSRAATSPLAVWMPARSHSRASRAPHLAR